MAFRTTAREHVGILKDVTSLRGNTSQSKTSNKVRFSPNSQLYTYDPSKMSPALKGRAQPKITPEKAVKSSKMDSTIASNKDLPSAGGSDSPESLISGSAYSTPEERGVAVAVSMVKVSPDTARVINIQRGGRYTSVGHNGSPVQRKPAGSNTSPSLRTGLGPTIRTSRDAYKVIMGESPAFPPRKSSLPVSLPPGATPPTLFDKASVVSRLSRPTVASSARAASTTTASASRSIDATATASTTRTSNAKKGVTAKPASYPVPRYGSMTSFKIVSGFKSRISAMITNRQRAIDMYQHTSSEQVLSRLIVKEGAVESPDESPAESSTSGLLDGDAIGADMDNYLSMSRDQLDRLVHATQGIDNQEKRAAAVEAVTAYGEALVGVSAARKAHAELGAAIVMLSRRTTDLGSRALAAIQG